MIKKLFLTACCVYLFSLSCSTDDLMRFMISEQDEINLGTKFKAEILSDTTQYPVYHKNVRVTNYIDSLGHAISDAQKERDTLPFTFTVIDQDTVINAFAVPGGHVFVYTGLLKAARNQAEVSGVLAHEIGHITMRHGVNKMVGTQVIGLVEQIIFGNDSTSIAKAVTDLVAGLVFLKFSRNDEFQADSCAVAYSTLIRSHPVGMKHFLKTLLDKYGEQPKIFEPVSTHPNVSDRITRVQGTIDRTANVPSDTTSWLYESEYSVIKSLL